MLTARDVMHPRVSLNAKDRGDIVVMKLMSPYPSLPVVNDEGEVIGVVSEFDVLDGLKHHATTHEFSAETIMSCGHEEHMTVCKEPVTINPDASIDDVLSLIHSRDISVLPVVEKGSMRLIGIITRKNLMNALAEKGFWAEREYHLHKV
ncbi:MAG: CBS domain-containing protein [Nitrospiraceae bacterium]|nr:CBS domain-containing protein [Nitrospiraceae bacterium]